MIIPVVNCLKKEKAGAMAPLLFSFLQQKNFMRPLNLYAIGHFCS